MNITQESIRQRATDETAFSAGKELFLQNRVSVDKVDSFWKNEVYITASVEDGTTDAYKTRIFFKDGLIGSCLCGCQNRNAREGLCRHGVAAALAYMECGQNQKHRPASTSPRIRLILDGYLKREKAKIMAEENEGPLILSPCLLVRQNQISVSFRTGKDQLYPVKDLSEFLRAVEDGAYLSYGKDKGFYHGIEAFFADSQNLVKMIKSMAQDSGNDSALSELLLVKNQRDAFFHLLADRSLEVINPDGDKYVVGVRETDPTLTVFLGILPDRGAAVWLEDKMWMFSSGRRIYLLTSEWLYCCGEAYSEDMGIFLGGLLEMTGTQRREEQRLAAQADVPLLWNIPRGAGCSVIGKRELPAFLTRVLPLLYRYCRVEQVPWPDALREPDSFSLADFMPAPLEASFYVDSPEPDVVTLSVTYRYGAHTFSPLSEKKAGPDYRDEIRELKISRILKRYFTERYLNTDQLVIEKDVERIYRFLSTGIGQLEAEGVTELSKSAAAIAVRPMPTVQVNLTLRGKWLKLEVEPDGLSQEDLENILRQYERKRPYYRKKDGTFLTVDQESLHTLWTLYRETDYKREADSSLLFPAGRLWYVNWLLDRDGRFRKTQDDYTDRLRKALEPGETETANLPAPVSLNGLLRPYQEKGFRWLASLDQLGFGGILADDMGLGKTLQILALLVSEKEQNPGQPPLSLVVCPSSLIFNWEQECRRFAPSLDVLPVVGNSLHRQQLLELADDYDLLLTSYDLLKRDAPFYGHLQFRYQIIDEAQYIKNKKTQCAKAVKSIDSVTRFALTGTPVENRLAELWSIFDYLMPGYLFSYARFRQLFENPLTKEGDKQESREALDRLLALIRPFLLRRTKKEVLTELPEKVENVVYAPLDGQQKKLYTAAALKLKQTLEDENTPFQQNRFRVLAQLTRLRQICCDPGLCYENYGGESAKLTACLELIENAVAGGHRLLVFSQFSSMLKIIGKKLTESEMPYFMLTGETSGAERERIVSQFGQNETQVFLISLKAGGIGLNLTAADMVIIYDPWWNAAAQNQAADRAHRLGQKQTVMVYQLIAKDTVEENIMRLQAAKQQLVRQVIPAADAENVPVTREDFLRILELQA